MPAKSATPNPTRPSANLSAKLKPVSAATGRMRVELSVGSWAYGCAVAVEWILLVSGMLTKIANEAAASIAA